MVVLGTFSLLTYFVNFDDKVMYAQSSRPQTISCRFISRLVLFSEQLLGLSRVPVNDISLYTIPSIHYHFSPRASCLEHLINASHQIFKIPQFHIYD